MSTKNIINQTDEFNKWLKDLKDVQARAKILVRIGRAKQGNFGDHKSVGNGIFEMKIDYGPGYRVYYAQQGKIIYLLLNGGTKASQQDDVKYANIIWLEIKG
ncbi:type II toxin-antitoxin system RelE/ParE family toxin [Advenella sp. WQ 585]|uniref:Type II toxin-antitoxin system RelE/ParE family toxin n=1 Tax=Advenella mandrilli TaxID=2800330 RepID=A0ABS1EI36_9BURK|nr:type II toxin-antitoxin system RelE/ParE family toxin [Advenella mandrilli]MBK1782671.1 type II toxin-antitoxin system RelE/ParE family toxin [Advenella mandrilli]